MHALHRANVHICMNAPTYETIYLKWIYYWKLHTIACAEQNSFNAMLPVMFVLNLLRGYVFALNQYTWDNRECKLTQFYQDEFQIGYYIKRRNTRFILGKVLCFCLSTNKYIYTKYILIFDLCFGIFRTNAHAVKIYVAKKDVFTQCYTSLSVSFFSLSVCVCQLLFQFLFQFSI